MPYTGSDPNLIDLQSQITNNLNSTNASVGGVQTQIKQVTLVIDGELNSLTAAFNTLQAFVQSGGSVIFVTPPASSSSTGTAGQMSYDANFFYVCVATNTWRRVSIVSF